MMQCLNTEYAGNVNSNCIRLKSSIMWIGKILKMEKNTEYRLMILILVFYERD